MKYGDYLVKTVKEGKLGGNKGLNHGLPRLKPIIPSVQRARIYTLLAGTGTGKSLFAMHPFGYEVLLDYYNKHSNNPKVVFKWMIYSMEMDLDMLLLRLCAYILFRDYNISISVDEIASVGELSLSEDIMNLIEGEIAPLLNDISKYIEVHGRDSVKNISTNIAAFYVKYGKIEVDEDGIPYYVAANGVKIFLYVTFDHIALSKGEGSVKGKIDDLASMELEYKILYKTTFFNVQQLNRDEGSIEKLKAQAIPQPKLDEAKGSGDMIDASDVVMALFNPERFQISVYMGWSIGAKPVGLGDYYRALWVLKNRSNKIGTLSLALYGKSGYFYELPERVSDFTLEMATELLQNIKFWLSKDKKVKKTI